MADAPSAQPHEPVRFATHPDRYKHWKLTVEGAVATLTMDIPEDGGLRPGYPLKLNSYDLGVDIELADAIDRLRFEHPEVRCAVLASGKDRVFCSGANIYMLGASSHAFKVNFCKFTNETRLGFEECSSESGIRFLCAINGPCAGGGYELALACDEVLLQDDGSSAVSLPEVPLLAVLPGTGGLTRLVDKRKVRRDLADVFCTLAEGVRGKRAVEWGLVDKVVPRSKFADAVRERANALTLLPGPRLALGANASAPLPLEPVEATYTENGAEYRYVSLSVDASARVATLTVRGPEGGAAAQPTTVSAMRAQGNDLWHLRAFRELDDALLTLRFNHETVGLVLIHTEGDAASVRAADEALARNRHDWFVREVALKVRRVLKRLDVTARSTFALAERAGSCFTGTLLELALSSDRLYMRDDPDASPPLMLGTTVANGGMFPMGNGLSRLSSRFLADPPQVKKVLEHEAPFDVTEALDHGLVTAAPDALDWDDELRIGIEERASLSPDALTGMEASLRYAGPETLETKIFARLSAWQNWIFTRPNATGPRGALTLYGSPERPEFDWRRT